MSEYNQVLIGLFKSRKRLRELSRKGPTLSGLEKIEEDLKLSKGLWSKQDTSTMTSPKIDRIQGLVLKIEEKIKIEKQNIARIAPRLYPVYLQLLRIKHSLNEMKKASEVFTCYDVAPLQLKLIEIEEEYIENGDFVPDKEASVYHGKSLGMILLSGQAILRFLLEKCYRIANSLLQSTDVDRVDPNLHPIYNALHSLRRKLERLKCHKCFSEDELLRIQKKLTEISSLKVDGKFMDARQNVLKGQAILTGLLEQNYEICHELLVSYNPISSSLKPIHNELCKMKRELEQISENSKFMIDPTEILWFYKRLVEIDETKASGSLQIPRSHSFLSVQSGETDESQTAATPQGQSVIHFLLHKCYRLVYNILNCAEPVDPSLKGIQSQLLALRRCLQELKNSHQGSIENDMEYCLSPVTNRNDPILRLEDLIPVQIKLLAIGKMKVDGHFKSKDGEIPAGQSTLNSLLNECYDSLYELMDLADQNEKEEKLVMDNHEMNLYSDEFKGYLGKPNLPVVPIVPIPNEK